MAIKLQQPKIKYDKFLKKNWWLEGLLRKTCITSLSTEIKRRRGTKTNRIRKKKTRKIKKYNIITWQPLGIFETRISLIFERLIWTFWSLCGIMWKCLEWW